MLPRTNPAVVHPHQHPTLKRMAVVLRQGPFSRGADVSENQSGSCLWGKAFQINTVPGREGRGEDAWVRAEIWVSVPAYAEAVAVVRSAGVKAETTVVGLNEDGVRRTGYEVGEKGG